MGPGTCACPKLSQHFSLYAVEPHEIAKFNLSFVSQERKLYMVEPNSYGSLWRGLEYKGFVIWPFPPQIIKCLVYANASLSCWLLGIFLLPRPNPETADENSVPLSTQPGSSVYSPSSRN